MSYGSTNGLKLHVPNYDNLLKATDADGGFTATDVTTARTAADNYINKVLADKGVPWTSLPLTGTNNLATVADYSDRLVACMLLRKTYIAKDPNTSDWVEPCKDIKEEIKGELDPKKLDTITGVAEDVPECTTSDEDRVFDFSRTSDGDVVNENDGTMDKW